MRVVVCSCCLALSFGLGFFHVSPLSASGLFDGGSDIAPGESADHGKRGYVYPATALSINIDVKKPDEVEREHSKVFISNLDEYKLFCLNEILRQNNIKFSYYRKGKSADLILLIPNDKNREVILSDFRYYGIDYSLDGRSLK